MRISGSKLSVALVIFIMSCLILISQLRQRDKVHVEWQRGSTSSSQQLSSHLHHHQNASSFAWKQQQKYERAPVDKAPSNRCQKVTRFVMIKTEKTGSTTLFSILARFILINNLNVMVMTKGGHLDVTKQRGEHPGWDIGPEDAKFADALVHHARYNESLLSEVISADAKYITLVRDAVSWFHSAMRFWPAQVKNKSPDEVLETHQLLYLSRSELKDHYNGQKTIFHLSQLQWLGFNYDHRNNMTLIQDYIKYIINRFDVGFITDEFDASLIRMKRLFCWNHEDIIYKSQEVGGRAKLGSTNKASALLTPQGIMKLLAPEANLGDQLLYEAFNETWWSNSDVDDVDFWDEVKQFQSTNSIVQDQCKAQVLNHGKTVTIPANKWSPTIKLDKGLCTFITMEHTRLMQHLAHYAIGNSYDPVATISTPPDKLLQD